MPRRRPRFSDLERQFREAGGTAEAGSRLAGYIDFKKGINKIEQKNKVSAADRKRYAYAVLPFGLLIPADVAITDRYQAPITVYSNSGRRALGLSDAQCGYADMAAGVNRTAPFYPAVIRAVVTKTSPTDSDLTPLSGVTKKNYKRSFIGASYGIPFGRTVTGVNGAALNTVGEEDVRNALTQALKAQTGRPVRSVSYLPEEFKSPQADLVSPPSTP